MEWVKSNSPLIIILLLSAALRFWNLNSNPPGLTWDEASLGYNAYSLLLTGRDEYGNFLPLILKSFGDYKPAVYAYLTVPSIAIFGLNEWGVRVPSAFSGILTVLLVYLLVLELLKNRWLALSAALFLSISPWHLQFSRAAFEANLALFLNTLAVYLFIKGIKNNKWLIASIMVFGLSLFSYQASKLFVPLIVLAILLIYKSKFPINIHTKIAALLFLLFLTITFYFTFWNGSSNRLEVQSLFAYRRSPQDLEIISKEDGLNQPGTIFNVLHGEWFSFTRGLLERYLIYFSPKMLFVDGDYNQRHRVPDLGVLYYFSAILIPLGVVYLLKYPASKVIFFWLLLAPLPAVLSRDLISTLRALNMVVPYVILEGAGLFWLFNAVKGWKKGWFLAGLTLISAIILINVTIFLDRYFIHTPKEYSKYWLYGYRQTFEKFKSVDKKYDRVVISDYLGQPYIYYLFYSKYNPANFQKQALLDQPTVDVGTVRRIDNIEFRHIYWPSDRGLNNTLFIAPEEELPKKDILPSSEFKVIDEVRFLNGELAFKMVGTR